MPREKPHICPRCHSAMRLHSVQNVLGGDKKGHTVRVYECLCGRMDAEEPQAVLEPELA